MTEKIADLLSNIDIHKLQQIFIDSNAQIKFYKLKSKILFNYNLLLLPL